MVDEVIKEIDVINAVEVPGEAVYIDRQVVREVPAPYFVDTIEQSVTADSLDIAFMMEWSTIQQLISFKLKTLYPLNLVPPNLALNEIVNWPDFTSETEKGANNLSWTISTDCLVKAIPTKDLTHYYENIDDDFIDMPRTFPAYENKTADADRHRD